MLVFPSLEAGNIGYKIAQRLGGYRAIGPLIQVLPPRFTTREAVAEEIIELALVASVPRQTDASRSPTRPRWLNEWSPSGPLMRGKHKH